MGNYKLNHSRNLDLYAKDIGLDIIRKSKEHPTSKQKKFYNFLRYECSKNDIKVENIQYTRVEYSHAIDRMLEQLKEKGIDIKHSGETFDTVIGTADTYIVRENNPEIYLKKSVGDDWIDCSEGMPEEEIIEGERQKLFAKKYKVKNIKTISNLVNVEVQIPLGNKFAVGRTINGKWFLEDEYASGGVVLRWKKI